MSWTVHVSHEGRRDNLHIKRTARKRMAPNCDSLLIVHLRKPFNRFELFVNVTSLVHISMYLYHVNIRFHHTPKVFCWTETWWLWSILLEGSMRKWWLCPTLYDQCTQEYSGRLRVETILKFYLKCAKNTPRTTWHYHQSNMQQDESRLSVHSHLNHIPCPFCCSSHF